MLEFSLWKKTLIFILCLGGVIVSGLALCPRNILRKVNLLSVPSVRLGLDLKGGVYLLYAVDLRLAIIDYMTSIESQLRDEFDKHHIHYANLAINNKIISFQLLDITPNTENLIAKIINNIDDCLLYTVINNTYNVSLNNLAISRIKKNVIAQSISVIRRRIDSSGTKEPIIQWEGNNRIAIQIPGISNLEEIKQLIGKTAKLTFHIVDTDISPEMIAAKQIPFQDMVLHLDNGNKIAVFRHVEVDGVHLLKAQATFQDGQPVVSFRFDNIGGAQFAQTTSNYIGKILAIVLDDVVISTPRINTPIIEGSGIIEGNFTLQQTQKLAILLRNGALPVPLHLLQEQSVGPGLGKDSIHAGSCACIISTISVFLFMLLYYGVFGLFADIALFFNITILLALLILFQVTLTLPGIAGIVLTIGMSVDSNVLSFERIKEENRERGTVLSSIESGYERAWSTVLDSNLTTLVAAFFLFLFGSGSVKGFAVTLSLGILTSIFTSIVVTRFLISLWFQYTRPKKIPI